MSAPQAFVQELHDLFAGLKTMTYYEFLGIHPRSDYVAVREAFHARAQSYHPDRFAAVAGTDLRTVAYEVFKRMTEAYNVLCDPDLRATYDLARNGGALRLADVDRSRRRDLEARQVSNTFARIYLRSARIKLERRDLCGAWIDVELGLGLEQAPPLADLLAEIRRHPDAAALLGFRP